MSTLMLCRLGAGIAALSLLAACGGAGSNLGVFALPTQSPTQMPTTSVTCPPSSPEPTPIAAWLAFPPNGSTNVAHSIGQIIEKGADLPNGGTTVTVSSPAGSVPLGTPTIAPSPYPTPFATTPPDFGMIAPYIAIPLPSLSPATTYTVNDVYTDWANNPPQCSAQYTQFVGTFTTGQ